MEFSKERKHMAERINMAGESGSSPETGPGSEGAPPLTDEALLGLPVGVRVRHVLGLPKSKQAAAIRRLGLEIGGGADTEPAVPEANQLLIPEGLRGPENETNPEKGRWLVKQIVEMRTTTMSYEERYSGENGRKLRWLYDSLQEYVNAISRDRNEKDPWDRYVRNDQGIVIGVKEIEGSLLEIEIDGQGKPLRLKPPPQISEQYEESVTDAERDSLRGHPLQTLLEEDANPATPAARRSEIQKQLSIYFGLAKKKGLLTGVDQVLESIHKDIKGVSADQARRLIAQRIGEARDAAEMTFDSKSMDQEVVDLYGVWNSYIRWARRRFELMLQGQNQPEYGDRSWEFRLPKGKSTEMYWEIGNYPKYYRVTANNQEQMLTAKETFLRMVKSGSLGKSPEAIYQHVDNFKEVFGQRGSELVEAGVIDSDFLTEQRQELEGQLYVFGADYSNETYNPKQYKEFMTAMALHEGPQRWVRLLRTGEGQVAAFTYMFDKEALMEIFNNPVGERGELDIIAQHYLQDQVMQMAIDRGMGVVLKDYDPRDPNNPIRFMADDEARKVREKELKANLERVGLYMSDEELKKLYEGFDNGYAHKLNFLMYGQPTDSQLQQIPNELKELAARSIIQLTGNQLQQLREILKDSIALGKIQLEIDKIRLEVQEGTTVLKRGQTLVNRLVENERISKKDAKLFRDAYDKAKANFEIAFQMQGASGEKVRRGKGFFYVDRNLLIQAYQEVEERSARIEWLLGELQKGKKLEEFSEEIQKFYRGLTDQEKQKNAQGLYGIGKITAEQQKSIQIGWMLSELREGRRFNDLSPGDKVLYLGLTDEEKVVNGDREKLSDQEKENCVAVYQKLRNTSDDKLSEEDRILKRAGRILSELRGGKELGALSQEDQNFYQGLNDGDRNTYVDHVPVYLAEKFVQYAVTRTKIEYSDESNVWDRNGFNRNGFIEIEMDGKKIRLKAKAAYRTHMMGQRRKQAIDEIKKNGFKATLELPKITFNTEGDVVGPANETEPINFQAAIKHIYSRYTTHTYWGYQGENREMILRPDLFEAAKRIRAGLSRPQDKDVLATQLLVIDPTLKRVKKFGLDEIQREITLFQAAVEESFLSHVYVNKALFKAFLPKDGARGKMRSGYNMEDWGGMMRFTMGIRELSASQPARFNRRLAAEIAIMPMYIDSMAAIWGQDGVMGAISMFADKIGDIGHQRMVSQFGITKFIDQQDYAVQLYNALIGSVQEGQHKEGLYMKPTNDNEVLHKFTEDDMGNVILRSPAKQLEYLQQLRNTFGRLETVLKIMRVMYSDVRNAGGALRLENVDIFLDNGKFNPAIESDPEIYMMTGTSRHLESDFYDEFAQWLISDWPGGGGQIYPDELVWNKWLSKRLYVYNGKQATESIRTFKRWFFEKAGL